MVLTLHLCALYGSQNKQQILPDTNLTDLFRRVRKDFQKRPLASSCLSVCLSVLPSAWNNWAPTGGDFHEIWCFFSIYRKIFDKSEASL